MSKWKRDNFLKQYRRRSPSMASPFSSVQNVVLRRWSSQDTSTAWPSISPATCVSVPKSNFLSLVWRVQLKIRVLKVNKDWTLVSSPCDGLPITESCACFMTVLFSYSLWHTFVFGMNKSDESAHHLSVIEQSWLDWIPLTHIRWVLSAK